MSSSGSTFLLLKRLLIAAGIGLILIIIFLSGVNHPKPEWGDYWKVRPIVIVTLAAAAGGLFYHLMDNFRSKGKWWKIGANIASGIAFLIALWMGTVLGLSGTLWN